MQKFLIKYQLLIKVTMAVIAFTAIALYGFFSVHTKFDEQGLIKKQEKQYKDHRREVH